MSTLEIIKIWLLSSELMMTALSVRQYGIPKTETFESAATGNIETVNQYIYEMHNSFNQQNIS